MQATNAIQNQQIINPILHGNCIDMMQQIPAQSVDFILTDPPYLVNYRDRTGRTLPNDRDDNWLYRLRKNPCLPPRFASAAEFFAF